MSASSGGAWLPKADQLVTGNWTFGTSTTTPTIDFTNATVKGISQSGGTFTNATLSGTTTIGTGATITSPTLVTPALGAATATSVAATGALSSSGGALGYATGAGGAVTQITSDVTGVTLNKLSGQITTVALSNAHGTSFQFTVTNSFCAAVTDV